MCQVGNCVTCSSNALRDASARLAAFCTVEVGLRRLFDDVVAEGVPPDMQALVASLEGDSPRRKGVGAGG